MSCLVAALVMGAGCSRYQPVKNVWKGTKGLWYEYVSQPASIDYDDKGELTERDQAFTKGMMGIDTQLTKLERLMANADKPPTRAWMDNFFHEVPWVDGFAGVKSDGSILGQETVPGKTPKDLDFNSILYEDKKQSTRALRCDVQQTPEGPEVMVAMPLYDGIDFLGCVVAYFNMESLAKSVNAPNDIVMLSPQALLWPGRYDFGSTPLAGVDWNEHAAKSSAGTCSNSNGTFAYQVRWLGNLPLIFGVVDSGSFPDGNGKASQGLAYFPKHEKMAPPPQQPKSKDLGVAGLIQPTEEEQNEAAAAQAQAEQQQQMEAQRAQYEEMMRQRKAQYEAMMAQRKKMIEERRRAIAQRQRLMREAALAEALDSVDAQQEQKEAESAQQAAQPSPFGPRKAQGAAAEKPAASSAPASEKPAEQAAPEPHDTLPGGRPSPFGPRKAAPAAAEKPAPAAAPAAESAAPEKKQEAPAASEKKPSEESSASGASQEKANTLPGGRPSPFGPRK